MRCSNVDFPVPFAPRMAIRESMLQVDMRSVPSEKNSSAHSIPNESFLYR